MNSVWTESYLKARLPRNSSNAADALSMVVEGPISCTKRVLLLPGLGHVPHLEAPDTVVPPLVAFLKEGLAAK